MSERVRAGAYIIRNKYRSLVLHALISEFEKQQESPVVLMGQDESAYHCQQIWWIEPIPYQEHSNSYIITCAGTGQALENIGGQFEISKNVGKVQQRWRIGRFTKDDERLYYNIISLGDERVMDITSADAGYGGPALCTSDAKPDSVTQRWEFLRPVVAVPPGCVLIINSSTGHVLSHDYNTNPPTLIPPPAPVSPQYREAWGTHWCFHKIVNTSIWNDKETARSAWVIKNRLTDAVLHVEEDKNNFWTVQASEKKEYNEDDSWSLEFDEDGNWIIRNEERMCLLEEGSQLKGQIPGNELICKDKRFCRAGGKSWLIRPAVEVDDGSPVDGCCPVDTVPVPTPAPSIQVRILPHNHPQVHEIKGELCMWNLLNSEKHTLAGWAWHCHRDDQAILVLGQGKDTVQVGSIRQKTGVVKFRRELFADTKLRGESAVTILGRKTEDGEREITTIIFD